MTVKSKDKKTVVATPPVQPLIQGRVDAVLGGGFSLAVAIIVIIGGALSESKTDWALGFVMAWLFTDLLINSPHFIASYRILYSNKKNIAKHPFVTVAIPILGLSLLAYVCYWGPLNISPEATSAVQADNPLQAAPANIPQPYVMMVLTLLAPVLLGWHYTGQSWGTTACFAYLAGFRMNPSQRKLIWFGFLALFAYHLTWACAAMKIMEQLFPQQRAGEFMISALMSACRVLVLASFFAGLLGFFQLAKEHQRRIPAAVWLPWVATYSWYVMVDVYPQSFFLLQIFHALQYLMFPARVEMNEHRQAQTGTSIWSGMGKHMLLYYGVLVVVGYLAFEWASLLEWTDLTNQSGTMVLLGAATVMYINIHHYFIDAVIWKIREPEVRESLFGHLEPH